MAADPRKAEVLAALSEIKSENLVQEERARKAQVRKSKVGADLEVEDAEQAEKKGVRKEGMGVVHRCTVVIWYLYL